MAEEEKKKKPVRKEDEVKEGKNVKKRDEKKLKNNKAEKKKDKKIETKQDKKMVSDKKVTKKDKIMETQKDEKKEVKKGETKKAMKGEKKEAMKDEKKEVKEVEKKEVMKDKKMEVKNVKKEATPVEKKDEKLEVEKIKKKEATTAGEKDEKPEVEKVKKEATPAKKKDKNMEKKKVKKDKKIKEKKVKKGATPVEKKEEEPETDEVTDESEHEKEEEEEEEEEGKKKKKVKKVKKEILFKGKKPYSSVQKHLLQVLPEFFMQFLYCKDPKDFRITRLLLCTGFGGFIGIGLFFQLIDPMSLYENQKMNLLYALTASFAIGYGTSTNFRCTTIMIAPNMLGKEGRTYLYIYVIASIYAGPIQNLQDNMDEVLQTIGCAVELQINHTKLMLKITSAPFIKIVQDLIFSGNALKQESSMVDHLFNATRLQVTGFDGFDKDKFLKADNQAANVDLQNEENEILSDKDLTSDERNTLIKKAKSKKRSRSQEKFNLKTLLRCEYVAELGIDKCKDNFAVLHDKCMKKIWVPFINSLLCLPMTFTFLCNIMRLIIPFCKDKIPVDPNFGKTYDKVDDSVGKMNDGFEPKYSFTIEEQSMFNVNISKFLISDDIKETVSRRQIIMMKLMSLIRVIMSCTFVYLFISGFHYCNKYNGDIRYDNFYVTTYFKQVDARRKKKKKRHLLPLRKAEYSSFVFPCKIQIQGPEIKTVMIQFAQCMALTTFLGISFVLDHVICRIFEIIRKHSLVTYNFASRHKIEVVVGGKGLISNILKKTVAAFNSSSDTHYTTSNEVCLPKPIWMDKRNYVMTCIPLVVLFLVSLLQVYVVRMRRAISGFFFPKREKGRVLFLYNEYLRKRATYVDLQRKKIMRKARINKIMTRSFMIILYKQFPFLHKIIRRRCLVCNETESKESYKCLTPDCGVIYCRQCWRDMNRYCFSCMPYDGFISADSDSDHYSEDEIA